MTSYTMKNMIRRHLYILAFVAIMFAEACTPAGGEKRGHEFMPDMVHSTAYESNIYNFYYYNTWGTEEDYKKFVEPREPVNGTIPRGYAGVHYQTDQKERMKNVAALNGERAAASITIPPNGSVPYYYEDTEEERTRAMTEIVENPFPITEAGLKTGKELYDINCGICHGPKGGGLGYLVREANPVTGDAGGVYPAAPANFLLDEFVAASNGRYYHSIIYGKNVMGGYADKLSYEERWQVIHYIRSLQAKDQGLVYNETENTLNTVEIPGAALIAELQAEHEAHVEEDGSHGESGSHDEDAHHDGDHSHDGESHDHNH